MLTTLLQWNAVELQWNAVEWNAVEFGFCSKAKSLAKHGVFLGLETRSLRHYFQSEAEGCVNSTVCKRKTYVHFECCRSHLWISNILLM